VYTIRKQFAFEAAHHLEGLEPGHPCMRPHGHSYRVEIVLQGELVEHDFVRDYRALDALKQHIDNDLDHRDLNEVLKIPTTAENLAKYFFDWCKERWPEVASASVSETQKTWATYSEETTP
jgi:6-pyruvoyltetrahydropterin/6-carboxytetrahydropterin synthase